MLRDEARERSLIAASRPLDGPVEGRWLGRDLGHIWLMHGGREVSHRVVAVSATQLLGWNIPMFQVANEGRLGRPISAESTLSAAIRNAACSAGWKNGRSDVSRNFGMFQARVATAARISRARTSAATSRRADRPG